MQKLLALISAVTCAISTVSASNITIYDEDGYYGTSSSIGREDQETEPNMINNQYWDMEGFFLDGANLSAVAGFDFRDGYRHEGLLYTMGDIFIDVTGDAQYGTSSHSRWNNTSLLNYGYEYVLDVDWSNLTYNAYQLNSRSSFVSVIEGQNIPESNPFRLQLTSELLLSSGSLLYQENLTNAQTGFTGGTHYSVSGFNLAFLGDNTTFTSHLTMLCGNDNLMGRGTVDVPNVPEPSILGFLPFGLLLLAGIRRKICA